MRTSINRPNQSSMDSRLSRGSEASFETRDVEMYCPQAMSSGYTKNQLEKKEMGPKEVSKRTTILIGVIASVSAIPKLDESIEIYELLVS